MNVLHRVVPDVLAGFDWAVVVYALAINTSYLMLLALASRSFARYLRWRPLLGYEETVASSFSPPVSLLVPAYNEEAGIVESVSAMLALNYPQLEVVVVVDGATDATLDRLRSHFDLVAVPWVYDPDIPTRVAPSAVYVPRGNAQLVVVEKDNSGRADSLNVGINMARYPLVCMIDADSILDSDALIHVVQPFIDDPERVVATGGVIRAANGCDVMLGRITSVRMPGNWVARIQVVEYLRAFLLGRAGWSELNSLLVISGAFGLFRRDILVEVGGLDPSTIGEDAELVIRLHRRLRDQKRRYRIVFVAEPISWTEVPDTLQVLGRQRRRWARGLAEILWRHRGMMANPRYGRIGLFALPYYLLFEMLAPVIEVVGLVAVAVGVGMGAVNLEFGALYLAVTIIYAMALSIASLLIEEVSFHRYGRWRDLAVAAAVTLVENLGYRQAVAVFQIQGLWAALRGKQQVWGEMTRSGFGAPSPDAPPVPAPTAAGEQVRP